MPLLDWVNKAQAVEAASKVPYRLLQFRSAHGDESADNLLIQGDNLAALKALLPFYRGQVKCIYIDPPYNTQVAFEHYDDKLEHSQWLSMMYPRLTLLRELLRDDGVIFVQADDSEGQYLKVLMDEVFGRKAFVATFIWQKVDSPNDNKVAITPDHEYICCYVKNRDSTGFKQMSAESILRAYGQVDEDGRRCRDRLLKKNGKASLRTDRPTMFFPVEGPDGVPVLPIHDDGREARWSRSKAGVRKAIKEGKLVWKNRGTDEEPKWVPYVREWAPEIPTRPYPTIWTDVHTTRQAKAHHKDILADVPAFDTPKPEPLIARLLEIVTSPGDLVLDSFLGSGTTAAVAHKMGRRWIGIEVGDHAVSHCLPRLNCVIAGEDEGGVTEQTGWEHGGGFRFYTLGETVFDADGGINPEVQFSPLASFVWHFETGEAAPKKLTKPLLGVHEGTAYYLLYNGVLGDRRPQSGNVLTSAVLQHLEDAYPHKGPRVIYGEMTRLGEARLRDLDITFKQIPYDVRAR